MTHKALFRLFVGIIAVALNVMTPPVAGADGAAMLTVEKPWARASIMLSRPSVAYITIINRTAAPDRMLSASTPVAL